MLSSRREARGARHEKGISSRLYPLLLPPLLLLCSCGFQLRTDPAVGIKALHVSTAGPTAVTTDIRRILASGPTRLMATPTDAEANLRILTEARDKTVYTITSTGAVYEFLLRLTVSYEVTIPGGEEVLIAPTEITTSRVITYSAAAPTAKEAEEQLLFKDMQADIAGRILRHISAVKRLK
jgi:LPS-assembly lipoprotein